MATVGIKMELSSAVCTMSRYFFTLQGDCLARYKEKIKEINNIDPFVISENDFNYDMESLPPISSIDIVSYFVLTHSFYTGVQMKAYKSLEAYKYFQAGFVQKIGTIVINNVIVMTGKVKHSQRMNDKSLIVWVICQKDGSISSAHCTCMAGLSEVCSHVAALLFAAQYATERKEALSCTDVKSVWPVPSLSTVGMVKVRDMAWTKPPKTVQDVFVPAIDGDELVALLAEIDETGCSALSRVVQPFASRYETDATLLHVLDIYKPEYEPLAYDDLKCIANTVDISVTLQHCTSIATATVKQSECQEWYAQRSGRITASKFKAACRTPLQKPSLSLIKLVCYPINMKFNSQHTRWGVKNEKNALFDYKQEQSSIHHDFTMHEVGFIVAEDFPQFGALPDGFVSCSCCGEGCVEVKCPSTLKDSNLTFFEFARMKNTCLDIDADGKIFLNENYSYYYQIQMQMFVTKKKYCDFVVWSKTAYVVSRFFPDIEFWQRESRKALEFHSAVIMPELLGKYFTKREGAGTVQVWCVCRKPDDGKPMIQCDNDDCTVQWFHLDCLQLSDVPDAAVWYCDACL